MENIIKESKKGYFITNVFTFKYIFILVENDDQKFEKKVLFFFMTFEYLTFRALLHQIFKNKYYIYIYFCLSN